MFARREMSSIVIIRKVIFHVVFIEVVIVCVVITRKVYPVGGNCLDGNYMGGN